MSPAEKMQAWAEKLIGDARPGPTSPMSSVQDLVNVHQFFRGKCPHLFGMQARPSAFADPEALRRSASDALRAWFEHFESTGESDARANVWEVTRRIGLDLGLPEPEPLKRRRLLAEARDQALSSIGRPSEASRETSPGLADALARIRKAMPGTSFAKIGKYLGPADARDLHAASFEWLGDSWLDFAEVPTDPCFLPVAGADGDYLGALVHPLLCAEPAPVVFSFHEESPRMQWIAASLDHLERMIDEAGKPGRDRKKRVDAVRGPRSEIVALLLDYLPEGGSPRLPEWCVAERRGAFAWVLGEGDGAATAAALEQVYAKAGAEAAAFPLASLRAQALAREWSTRLRAG